MTTWVAAPPMKPLSDADRYGLFAPMQAVLELGKSSRRVGIALGVLVASVSHGVVSAKAITSLVDLFDAQQFIQAETRDFFDQMYEVEQPEAKKEEPPPPPPPPPPEPEPTPVAKEVAPAKELDPYQDDKPPPAPAEAQKIVTQEEDPDKPADMRGFSIVSGNSTTGVGGYQSAAGVGSGQVNDPRARPGGAPGGTGTGTSAAAAPPPDLSKPPELIGGASWSCPFPSEADEEQIDSATVTVFVTIRPDGTASSARLGADPGHGFGREAKQCALARRYKPGVGADGQPTTATLGPITVRFNR
jgi:protein TonB